VRGQVVGVGAHQPDDARYVTGVTLPVDAGFTNKK
jgi:hypothetical protein